MRTLVTVAFVYISLAFNACSPSYSRYAGRYNGMNGAAVPEYARLDYWAAHPFKSDPSDSIPAPLQKDYRYDSGVDVFFLHPTTLTDREEEKWNAGIDDALINAKTDYSSILYQASIFNEYRVFAPRYRQAHIKSYFTGDTASAMAAFELAYNDIKTSFEYYLRHFNNGRPIVIASHSQGTTHAMRLLKEYFDNTDLKQKLVAAYLVGMYISENYFSNLRICRDSIQTNCYCAWRTYRINYMPEFVKRESIKSGVTNPITWSISAAKAPRIGNAGSVLRNFNRVYQHVAGAEINGGVLWTPRPRFPGGIFLRTKNYHIGDLNLYYLNVRNNIRQRVASFKRG
jgi:hypothetical protein